MSSKTVEQMAKRFDRYSAHGCPASPPAIEMCLKPGFTCKQCWITYATPAQIRAKYAEMKGAENE